MFELESLGWTDRLSTLYEPFAGDNVIALRRQECLLHSDGEIAMGAPFSDFSAPMVSFKLVDGSVVLGPGGLRK